MITYVLCRDREASIYGHWARLPARVNLPEPG